MKNKIHIIAKKDGCMDITMEIKTREEVEQYANILKLCGYTVTVESRERQVGE